MTKAQLTLWEALKSRQGLTSVPLLDTDVNVVRLGSNVVIGCKRVALGREGVCCDRLSQYYHLENR